MVPNRNRAIGHRFGPQNARIMMISLLPALPEKPNQTLPEGMDPKVFAYFSSGGISPFYAPLTDPDVVEPARTAVHLYNKQQNARLKFVRVLKAFQQVVCRYKFYLTLEAIDAGVKNKYKAEIICAPANKFTLESFHLVET